MVLAFTRPAKDFLTLKVETTNMLKTKGRINSSDIIDPSSKENSMLKFKQWLDTQEGETKIECMYINDILLSKFVLEYPSWAGSYHVQNNDITKIANIIHQETGYKILYCGNDDSINLAYAEIGEAFFDESKNNVVNETQSSKRVDINVKDFIKEYDRLSPSWDDDLSLISFRPGHHREEYFYASIGLPEESSRSDIRKATSLETNAFDWGNGIYGILVKSGGYKIKISKDDILTKYTECKRKFNKLGISTKPVLILSMTNEDV